MFDTQDFHRPRVLLVEDVVSVRKRIRILIEEACPGIKVEETGSASAAIGDFQAHAANAAVINLHLEGQDAWSMLLEADHTQVAGEVACVPLGRDQHVHFQLLQALPMLRNVSVRSKLFFHPGLLLSLAVGQTVPG